MKYTLVIQKDRYAIDGMQEDQAWYNFLQLMDYINDKFQKPGKKLSVKQGRAE